MKRDSTPPPDWLLAAFDEFYRPLYAYLSRRVETEVAEDLASEVFAQAYQQHRRFDPALGSTAGWLFGIATNLVRGHKRSELRRLKAYGRHGTSDFDDGGHPGMLKALDAEHDRQRLTDAIAQLSDERREALMLVCGSGLSYQEVAQALEVPVGTVRSRLSRARRDMRKFLVDEEEGQTGSGPAKGDVTWIS